MHAAVILLSVRTFSGKKNGVSFPPNVLNETPGKYPLQKNTEAIPGRLNFVVVPLSYSLFDISFGVFNLFIEIYGVSYFYIFF
jgi:hypothetical protein